MARADRSATAKIEQTAQAILDARALYPDSSLADLYDELTMPPELRKAHRQNDMAVMQAYGFTKGSEAIKAKLPVLQTDAKISEIVRGTEIVRSRKVEK